LTQETVFWLIGLIDASQLNSAEVHFSGWEIERRIWPSGARDFRRPASRRGRPEVARFNGRAAYAAETKSEARGRLERNWQGLYFPDVGKEVRDGVK
jgi:hypothetical protein